MIELHNVMDIRTGKIYSEVIVKAKKAKWFVPVEEPEAEPETEE